MAANHLRYTLEALVTNEMEDMEFECPNGEGEVTIPVNPVRGLPWGFDTIYLFLLFFYIIFFSYNKTQFKPN